MYAINHTCMSGLPIHPMAANITISHTNTLARNRMTNTIISAKPSRKIIHENLYYGEIL